jgi:ariadne-1
MEFDDHIYEDDAYDSCGESEGFPEEDDNAPGDAKSTQMKYTILSLKDIGELQHNAIASVCRVLSVSEVEAGILLRHFYWDADKVYDQWSANEEKVRNAVGLLLQDGLERRRRRRGGYWGMLRGYCCRMVCKEEENELITCPICFDGYTILEMKELKYCGHLFCEECWRGYIHTSINNDGLGCLNLRCPNLRCRAVVSEDMVFSLGLSEDDNSKYRKYLVRSYVEQNSDVKWCPAPNCQYAVKVDDVVDASQEVVCNCSYKFCWNCLQESHRPIDCDTVRKWVSMISDGESQNLYWILRNSKPCPMCKRPIEKNFGCIHMTCLPPCGFQFCWICLSEWKVHGFGTAAPCNQYRLGEQSVSEDVMKLNAKMSSDRLLFYLERWKANEKYQEKALSDLQRLLEVEPNETNDSQFGITRFKCVVDAWVQIAECRRMLKWTYVYGHYLPLLHEHDHDVDRVKLLELLQCEAEKSLELLHQCAEHELQHYIGRVHKAKAEFDTSHIPSTSKDFDGICGKLKNLTKVTVGCFEKLIKAFESGVSEVDMTGGSRLV